jgi:hypothetical protein
VFEMASRKARCLRCTVLAKHLRRTLQSPSFFGLCVGMTDRTSSLSRKDYYILVTLTAASCHDMTHVKYDYLHQSYNTRVLSGAQDDHSAPFSEISWQDKSEGQRSNAGF